MTASPPSPYRLKSTVFHLQVPSFGIPRFSDSKFLHNMKNSDTWRLLSKSYFTIRTWSRRTIWGDRVRHERAYQDLRMLADQFYKLFLHFRGPTSILIQTRGVRLNDILSREESKEIAETAPGNSMKTLLHEDTSRKIPDQSKPMSAEPQKPLHMSLASVGKDGKVTITQTEKSI